MSKLIGVGGGKFSADFKLLFTTIIWLFLVKIPDDLSKWLNNGADLAHEAHGVRTLRNTSILQRSKPNP